MKKLIYVLILLFLASCNRDGRTLQEKQDVTAEINPMGQWLIGNYVDGFGDPTGEQYLYISGKGEISAYIKETSKGWMYLALNNLNTPYNKDPYFWLQYKRSDGFVSDWIKLPAAFKYGYALKGEGTEELVRLIMEGETLKFQGFSADNPNSVCFKGIKDTHFSFDFSHYKDAASKVKWIEYKQQ